MKTYAKRVARKVAEILARPKTNGWHLAKEDMVEGAPVLCLLDEARKESFPGAPPVTENSAAGEMLLCHDEGVVFVVIHNDGVEHMYLPAVPCHDGMRYKEAQRWMGNQMEKQLRKLREPFGSIEDGVPRVFRLERISSRWIMEEWNLPIALRATRNYWVEAIEATENWYYSQQNRH